MKLSDTDHTVLMSWKRAMDNNGRSKHYIAKFFKKLRLVASYGKLLEDEHATRVRTLLSEMRIQQPPARSVHITRDQVTQIITYADADDKSFLSLSILFQFTYMLRGVDVYGQWVQDDKVDGGIRFNGKNWIDGLTWDMIEPDLSCFTKVISKTEKSLPEPYVFDITPEIRQRLMDVPVSKRIGPVIAMPDGTPPRENAVSLAFRRIKRALDLPEQIQIRDLRPGAITEARDMVDKMVLRNAAQHREISTTDSYVRARSKDANKVVQLRQKNAI